MEESTAQEQTQQNVASQDQQATAVQQPRNQTEVQEQSIGTPQGSNNDSLFANKWIWVLVVLLVLLGIGLALVWFYVLPSMTEQQSSTSEVAPGTTQTTSGNQEQRARAAGNNTIVVEDQPITEEMTIKVDRVEVNTNAFLAFYMPLTDSGGDAELEIAATSILVPDVYEDFETPIYSDPQVVDKIQLSRIRAGGRAYATLYEDTDGNRIFNPMVDQRLKNSSGNDIRVEFELIPQG